MEEKINEGLGNPAGTEEILTSQDDIKTRHLLPHTLHLGTVCVVKTPPGAEIAVLTVLSGQKEMSSSTCSGGNRSIANREL